MMKYLLLLSAFIVFFSCNDTEDTSLPIPTTFTEIANAELSIVDDLSGREIIVTNQTEFDALINDMNYVEGHPDIPNDIIRLFTESDIDYTNYMVVAVFDTLRTTNQYDIEISQLDENDTTVTFTVSHSYPDPSGFVNDVMTMPFQVIKMTKTDKEIRFVHE